jgi:integrase/recombinase XerD
VFDGGGHGFVNKRVAVLYGLPPNISLHSLRHSFATHLLEKGTDVKYIKELLGHFDIKTTERYLHISRQSLINIISPLDDLFKREKIEW